jgi:hypothetical protein
VFRDLARAEDVSIEKRRTKDEQFSFLPIQPAMARQGIDLYWLTLLQRPILVPIDLRGIEASS